MPLDAKSIGYVPLNTELDFEKLLFCHPEHFNPRSVDSVALEAIKNHLEVGNTEPAIVVNSDPLLIAVYSDDLDCVLILGFDDKYAKRFNYEKGKRLISINTYGRNDQPQMDIIRGKHHFNDFNAMWPVIADMICSDEEIVASRIQSIDEAYWKRLQYLADYNVENQVSGIRDGAPMNSCYPSKIKSISGACEKCGRSSILLINSCIYCTSCGYKNDVSPSKENRFLRPIITAILAGVLLWLNFGVYVTIDRFESSIEYIKYGRYIEAKEILEELYGNDTKCIDFEIWYAIASYKSGDTEGAKALLKSIKVYNSMNSSFTTKDYIFKNFALDPEIKSLIEEIL